MQQIQNEMDKHVTNKTFRLSDNGMTIEKLQQRLHEWGERDRGLYGTGKVSGGLYVPPEKKFEEQV